MSANAKIGYARVSTSEQDLGLQIEALKNAECERIFQDKISGAILDRPGLQEALACLKKDDTLVVWKLDRLGRSLKNLIDIAEHLKNNDIHLLSVTECIDTKTSAGRFFFHMMGALAEVEREHARERTLAGLANARQNGRIGGRKPVLTPEKLEATKKLLALGQNRAEIARVIGVSVATIYRHFPASHT